MPVHASNFWMTARAIAAIATLLSLAVPGCGTTGPNDGWLIASTGAFESTFPLSPKNAPPGSEWSQHPASGTPSACPPPERNSRTQTNERVRTNAAGTATENVPGFPVTAAYDAAGNLRRGVGGGLVGGGTNWYQYDGFNRLTDVFQDVGGVKGPKVAQFSYDSSGQHVSSRYDTDKDGSLADEDTEWTPRPAITA